MEEIAENEERESARANQKKSGEQKRDSSQNSIHGSESTDFDDYDELVS